MAPLVDTITNYTCVDPNSAILVPRSATPLPQLDYKFKMNNCGVVERNGCQGNVLVVYDMLRHCNRQLSNVALFQTKMNVIVFLEKNSIQTLSTIVHN